MDFYQEDSKINNFLSKYLDNFVGDVANVNYNKYSVDTFDHFIPVRPLFCDNIVVRKLVNYNDVVSGNYNVVAASNFIRSFFMDNGFVYFNISFLDICRHDITDDSYSSLHSTYAQRFDNYVPGYVSFKISLSGEDLCNILQKLVLLEEQLNSSFVFVHNIDITLDCAGNISRGDILQFLLSKNINKSNIINNVHKVGNNCISWNMVTTNNIFIICKIYNKFVQMLESHEVRRYIGSRISDIIANSSSVFRNALHSCKEFGMTRLEIKIPYNSVHKYNDYLCLMDEFMLFMQGCKIYKTSFENQWKALVDNIDNMNVLAVYVSNRKIFAYCHWYNSLTSKKQGCIKRNINESQVPIFLTNYSFNNGNICYKKIVDNGQIYNVILTSQYRRVKEGITLVPGPNNSLNPERSNINSEILCSFDNIGLCKYKGIHLEWPLKTKQLSELEEVVDNDQCMKNILTINNREYKSAHRCLLKHTKYKVCAISFGTFKSKNVVYAILSLQDNNINLIKTKFGEYVVKFFNSFDTSNVFYIKTGNFIYNRSNNLVDIEVFLD